MDIEDIEKLKQELDKLDTLSVHILYILVSLGLWFIGIIAILWGAGIPLLSAQGYITKQEMFLGYIFIAITVQTFTIILISRNIGKYFSAYCGYSPKGQ